MSEGVEEQQPSPVEQGKPHYSATEVSKFLDNRTREQGNIPPWRQETAQNQRAESRSDEALGKLEKGDVIGYMDEENKRYLRENAETPEQAEQLMQIYENAKELQEAVVQFNKDDPDIPASEETKQKLIDLTDINDKYGSLSRKAHMYATISILTSILGGGFMELATYINGGPPGVSSEVGLAIAAALGGSIEGYTLTKKGAEKLKALIAKNKPTGAEAPQSARTQTEDNSKT